MTSDLFAGRVFTLAVTSGIACYKAVDLMRDLQRFGARVRVIMSKSAAKLVGPALFEALSGERVGLSLWEDWPSSEEAGEFAQFPHLDYARGIDAFIVAPATANTLAKAATGLADDLLSTSLAAIDARITPVLFVPSMNATMYSHPAAVENRSTLMARGCAMVTPDEGPLACGEVGVGRWPGNDVIVAALDRLVNGTGELADRRVIVTAGRTEADIDPARVLTNRSTGKMGFAIARAAWRHGARVTLIHGPTSLTAPPFVDAIMTRTVSEMGEAVREGLSGADQLWMAAAVNDWEPKQVSNKKKKKNQWDGALQLERTEDILRRAAGERDSETTLIGFAVETDDVEARAREKLAAKGCDYLIVNNPLEPGAGFGHDTNHVFVLNREGTRTEFDPMSKERLADDLLRFVMEQEDARAHASQ